MLKKILYAISAIILIGCAGLVVTGNGYVFKALLYNFADIDDNKIFEERILAKSTNPQPWAISQHYNKVPLPDTLDRTLKELETVAFLVIKKDSILFENYADQYDPKTISNSFSMAKSVISMLVGVAIGEGKIKSVDQHVGDFLPEFTSNGKEKLTIRHLLTMSSGLDWVEGYSSPLSPTTQAYYGSDLKGQILSLGMKETPGKIYRYQSCDTQILAFVLEKATGKKVADYADEKIWNPIGAETDAEWSTDKKDGDEKAYCCFFSNARDFARLGKLYLNKGAWNGQQIIPADYVEASLKPSSYLIDEDTNTPVDFYGYQWWLLPNYKGHNIFYARGILGQYVIMIPDKNIILVRLGKKRGEKVADHHLREVFQMVDAGLGF